MSRVTAHSVLRTLLNKYIGADNGVCSVRAHQMVQAVWSLGSVESDCDNMVGSSSIFQFKSPSTLGPFGTWLAPTLGPRRTLHVHTLLVLY